MRLETSSDAREQDGVYQKVIAASGDKILISGDIAEAASVSEILKEMGSSKNNAPYYNSSKKLIYDHFI